MRANLASPLLIADGEAAPPQHRPPGSLARRPPGRRIGRWLLVALLAGWAMVSCGDDGGNGSTARTTTADSSDPQLPAWVQEVKPTPGAADSAERAVTVNTRTLEPTEELRLLIDDVDVTAQALVSEPVDPDQENDTPTMNGRLRYDPRDVSGDPLVPLQPGEHSATAELRARPAFGEPTRLVDSYTWTFVLQ
jgi:hypothetical protein